MQAHADTGALGSLSLDGQSQESFAESFLSLLLAKISFLFLLSWADILGGCMFWARKAF